MGVLDGKVALVTGGASGIGAATVRLFAAEGARVLAVDVQDALGEALAKELGDAVAYQRADVSREDDVAAAVDRAVRDVRPPRRLLQQRRHRRRDGTDRGDPRRRVRPQRRGAAARRLPRHQARGARDGPAGLRQHPQHRERRGAAGRPRPARLQHVQGGRRAPDAQHRDGARRVRRARELHLPRRHRDAAARDAASAARRKPSR